MLSEKSRPVIESTLPLIGSRIGAITVDFYNRLSLPTLSCSTVSSAVRTSVQETSRGHSRGASRPSPRIW